MKKNGFTLIEVMIVAAVVGLLLATAASVLSKFVGISTVYSEGERTGVLVKLSKKGFVWKTWEGELNLGGMSVDGGGVAVPNIWRFSVADDAIAQQMLPAAQGAQRVTVTYKEVWKASFAQGETDYFATGVRR
jgi:prepilin-type N-terminal cleavage/methylation domain-containing protein